MKVYNVNVYDIDQFGIKYGKMGFIKSIGKIMVTKNFFSAKEIITHQPIIVFSNDSLLSRI